MGGIGGQGVDGCLDGDLFLDHLSAGGSFRLVADKEDVVGRVFQALAEMVDNPAAGAHAAAGDDDRRAGDIQQLFMVLVFLHSIEPLEIKGVVAPRLEVFRLFIPEAIQACINFSDPQAQGGIDKHRNLHAYPVQFVEQLLGSAQGKGGDIDNAFIGEGLVEHFAERVDAAFSARMRSIAVGGFEDEQVTALGRVGIGQDGGVGAAEVAGEDHPIGLVLISGKSEQDKARAEDVPGIAQFKGDLLFQGKCLVQFKAPCQLIDQTFQAADILVGPAGKRHGVTEHGQEQRPGGMGADDLAPESGIEQVRHPADVVDMGVGEKQIVYFARRDRELVKGQQRVIAIGAAAVDEDVYAVGGTGAGFYQVTGTGDAFFGAEVAYFYVIHFSFFSLICINLGT